jgi:hypothetical protein
MESKGFYFLGSNLRRNNAFFISKEFDKNIFFPNIKISDISENVDCNIRESRGVKGELTYLSGNDRIEKIRDCEIVDLEKNRKIKIKDLFKI